MIGLLNFGGETLPAGLKGKAYYHMKRRSIGLWDDLIELDPIGADRDPDIPLQCNAINLRKSPKKPTSEAKDLAISLVLSYSYITLASESTGQDMTTLSTPAPLSPR